MPEHQEPCFEWDTDKSDRAFARHGFDFKFASRIFNNDLYVEALDDRVDYGEDGYIAVGLVEGVFVTLVYTPREPRRRILSTWRSRKPERDEYAKANGYEEYWADQLE